MSRSFAIMMALALTPLVATAEDTPVVQEIRELKELVGQQMKRLDELTVQIGRLHQSLEAQRAANAPGPEPKREVVGPPPFSGVNELKPDAEPAPAEAPKMPASTVGAPKAEAVGGIKHVVAKGETLTSIAKHYNIGLADLQKANRDVNDRKLQIGQTVMIPVTKPSEPKPAEAAATDRKDPL